MRLITASALSVAALAIGALPATAAPACDKAGSTALHEVDEAAPVEAEAIHRIEAAYCRTDLP